jgi:hypothetical protein
MKAIAYNDCDDCPRMLGCDKWTCDKDGDDVIPTDGCPLPDVPEVPDGLLPNPLDAIEFVQKLRGMK